MQFSGITGSVPGIGGFRFETTASTVCSLSALEEPDDLPDKGGVGGMAKEVHWSQHGDRKGGNFVGIPCLENAAFEGSNGCGVSRLFDKKKNLQDVVHGGRSRAMGVLGTAMGRPSPFFILNLMW